MNASGTTSANNMPAHVPLGATVQANACNCTTDSDRNAERRVLFISYAFPPTGGGGVQRAVKFAKYLPHYGWRPTILTVANPSVPVHDHDLAADLDPATQIVRAKTWEPGYGVKKQLAESGPAGSATVRSLLRQLSMQVLQPDPQILWNPSALRVAVQTLRTQLHDAIFVTGPPFSSFLLGCKLKKRFGIPLVLDFRDEWMLVAQYLENYQFSGLAYRRQRAMMQKTLRAADAVVATTRSSATELARACREVESAATVVCIYNGFDPADLIDLSIQRGASQKLRIVYTGTLWKLTNIEPLVLTLEALAQRAADGSAGVELVVAGRRTPQQDAVLERLHGTGVSVVRHDYLPHGQSLNLAATADLLLLLLDDQPGAERVVPAKLFEYLALQKPILAIGPEGETSELLRRHGPATMFQPAEVGSIARWLETQLDNLFEYRTTQVATSKSSIPHSLAAQFSRASLTKELVDVLQGVAGRKSKVEGTSKRRFPSSVQIPKTA